MIFQLAVHDQQKALHAAGDDVGEAPDRDQIGHQGDDVKLGAVGAGNEPHHRGDQEAGGDAPEEHLDPAVHHGVTTDRQHGVVSSADSTGVKLQNAAANSVPTNWREDQAPHAGRATRLAIDQSAITGRRP